MTPHIRHRSSKTFARWLACAAGALTLGASMPGVAGEALDIELPSMRTPIEAVQTSAAVQAAATLPIVGPLTRADVRESLKTARAANTMSPSGEIGDTAEVLQARENFYAAQTEFIEAQYAAAALREQALREQIAAAEQQLQDDLLVAELMRDETAVEEGAMLATSPEAAPAAAAETAASR